jgi:hypothetical protein
VFYTFLAGSEQDEETQKRGFVGISYFTQVEPSYFLESWKVYERITARQADILDSLPIRNSSIHLCLEQVRMGMLKNLITLTIGRDRRIRLRIHDGTYHEGRLRKRYLCTFSNTPLPFH